MHGIVSLLDNDHYQLVEEVWAESEGEFSVHGVYVTPYPHFSYHVAQGYDVDKVESVLQRITSNITTFKVRTSGLGIFTGASPVLYIPVARSLELAELHQEFGSKSHPQVLVSRNTTIPISGCLILPSVLAISVRII